MLTSAVLSRPSQAGMTPLRPLRTEAMTVARSLP